MRRGRVAPWRRETRLLLVALIIAVACSRDLEVPTPANTVEDPDLAALLARSIAGVRDSPGDADAWAALAMAYDCFRYAACLA